MGPLRRSTTPGSCRLTGPTPTPSSASTWCATSCCTTTAGCTSTWTLGARSGWTLCAQVRSDCRGCSMRGGEPCKLCGTGAGRQLLKRCWVLTPAARRHAAELLCAANFTAPMTNPIGISNDIMAAAPGDAYLGYAVRRLRHWNRWMGIKYIQASFHATQPASAVCQFRSAAPRSSSAPCPVHCGITCIPAASCRLLAS